MTTNPGNMMESTSYKYGQEDPISSKLTSNGVLNDEQVIRLDNQQRILPRSELPVSQTWNETLPSPLLGNNMTSSSLSLDPEDITELSAEHSLDSKEQSKDFSSLADFTQKVREGRQANLAASSSSRIKERLKAAGDEFTLNKLDVASLQVYGREKEIEKLKTVLELVIDAARNAGSVTGRSVPSLVSITGYSGMGKSSLAVQLRPILKSKNGFFVQGKFDVNQNLMKPFGAFSSAFENLIGQIVQHCVDRHDCDGVVEKLREILLNEMDILSTSMPNASQMLGIQAENDGCDIDFSRRGEKVQFLFRRLIRIIADMTRPVVMLIDDVQGADTSSLELLQSLATDSESSGFLMITTARDNEMDIDHPFRCKLSEIEGHGFLVEHIEVKGLETTAINEMLATVLRTTEVSTSALAEIVQHKTKGNPFFVIVFLQLLIDAELLSYSFGALRWVWNDKEIARFPVTDNVADLLKEQLIGLGGAQVYILQVSALLGQSFDPRTLSLAVEQLHECDACPPMSSISLDVDSIIEILVDYGFLQRLDSLVLFSHDQIQTAALSSIPATTLPLMSVEIGQRLLVENDGTMSRSFLLAVDLCNSGLDYLGDKAKLEMAEQNLKAGEAMMKGAAFVHAQRYFEAGLKCLGTNCWQLHHSRLTLELTSQAAIAARCSGDWVGMELRIMDVLDRYIPAVDKVRIYVIRVSTLVSDLKFNEAIFWASRFLEELGFPRLPKSPGKARAAWEIIKTKRALRNHDSSSLVQLPSLHDAKIIGAMAVIDQLSVGAFASNPSLLAVLISRSVAITLKFGACKYSPFSVAFFGVIMASALDDHELGASLCQAALSLSEREEAKALRPRTIGLIYSYGQPMAYKWTGDLRSVIEIMKYTHQLALESGDVECAMLVIGNYDILLLLTAAQHLRTLYTTISTHLKTSRVYRLSTSFSRLLAFKQVIKALIGDTSDPSSMEGDEMEEVEDLAQNAVAIKNLTCSIKMQLAYLFDEYDRAAEYAEKTKDFCVRVAPGNLASSRHFFFRGMTLIAHAGLGRRSRRNKSETFRILRRLRKWISCGAIDVIPMVQLLQAEIALVSGKAAAAEDLYKAAIQSANRTGYIHDHALCHERAALFYIQEDKSDCYNVEYHVGMAIRLYREWGASAKVQHLERKHADVLSQASRVSETH